MTWTETIAAIQTHPHAAARERALTEVAKWQAVELSRPPDEVECDGDRIYCRWGFPFPYYYATEAMLPCSS